MYSQQFSKLSSQLKQACSQVMSSLTWSLLQSCSIFGLWSPHSRSSSWCHCSRFRCPPTPRQSSLSCSPLQSLTWFQQTHCTKICKKTLRNSIHQKMTTCWRRWSHLALTQFGFCRTLVPFWSSSAFGSSSLRSVPYWVFWFVARCAAPQSDTVWRSGNCQSASSPFGIGRSLSFETPTSSLLSARFTMQRTPNGWPRKAYWILVFPSLFSWYSLSTRLFYSSASTKSKRVY